MESAFIRIKFEPLIKNITKTKSHYSLEIIPVASCIENIDKIEMKNTKHSIEYTLPITYKIQIKKQDPCNDSVRIYHSCIDLVSSTSILKAELSECDIPRLVSESFILNRTRNDCVKSKSFVLDVHLNSKTNKIREEQFFSEATTNIIPIQFDEKTKQIINDKDNDFISPTKIKHDNYERISNIKDDKSVLRKNLKYIDSFIPTVDIINGQETKSKKQFCTTPVYNKAKDNKNRLDIINVKKDLLTNLLPLSLDDYDNRKGIGKADKLKMNFSKILYNNPLEPRILPEVRIANFVENLEREIFPLKVILNDIINKCISSNIYKQLLSASSINNIYTQESSIKQCNVQNYLKSNRVVYSIVFND